MATSNKTSLDPSSEFPFHFFQQIPGILWTTDHDLRITLSIGAGLSDLGLAQNEVNGKTLYEYFNTSDKNFLSIAAHLAALKGDSSVYEVYWQNRTYFFQISPLRDSNSQIIGTIGAAVDITERKAQEDVIRRKAEQAFRYQEGLLNLAKMPQENLDQSLKKIISLDTEALGVERTSIWFFNPERSQIHCKILYHHSTKKYESGSALKAKDYPEYFRALEKSRTIAANDATIDPRTCEFRDNYLKPQGITSMMDVPIRSQGEVVGVVCHEHVGPKREWSTDEQEFAASIADMVALSLEYFERRRAEQALHHTTEELQKSNKELESFAYVASHDLQEPLHKIIGFSDRLTDLYHHTLDERARDYLERIGRAAQGMRRLIEDLLRFSRVTLRAKPHEPIDLNQLLQEVRSDLDLRLHEVNGTIEFGNLPIVHADRTQMHQLFQNLISNGLKFHHPTRPPRIVVQCEPSASDSVVISIQDNGIGMEKEFLTEIFKPFYRLHGKADYEGSGIGLALCEKIVKHHGGNIFVKSKKGEGSLFQITLPLGMTHG